MSNPNRLPSPLLPLTSTATPDTAGSTPDSRSVSTRLAPISLRDVSVSPEFVNTVSRSSRTSIFCTSPRTEREITSLMGISCAPPMLSENSVKKMASTATVISRYMNPFRINLGLIAPPCGLPQAGGKPSPPH